VRGVTGRGVTGRGVVGRRAAALGTLLALAAAPGCGGRGAADVGRGVEVRGAWARPTPGPDAAAYLTVVNHTAETVTITGARTPAAAGATLHETVTAGAGMHAMVHMVPLAQVSVAPGDSAAFAPGGRHLMLARLRAPLAVGARVPLTLVTAAGDELRTEVEVRSP
jgi:hypothetical protein